MKRRSPVYNTIRSQKNPPFSCTLLSPEYAFGKKIWVCHAVQCCKLQPTALYISAVVYNTTWFLLHLCAFGKKLCSAATCRLIHFRSCQMGRGPSCRAVTLHPTSYCTVTLSVLCHSNEVLLWHNCSIPVQMQSQRTAVPLLMCLLLKDWKRVRPSKLCLGNSLQYISTRSCHTAGNDTSGAD